MAVLPVITVLIELLHLDSGGFLHCDDLVRPDGQWYGSLYEAFPNRRGPDGLDGRQERGLWQVAGHQCGLRRPLRWVAGTRGHIVAYIGKSSSNDAMTPIPADRQSGCDQEEAGSKLDEAKARRRDFVLW